MSSNEVLNTLRVGIILLGAALVLLIGSIAAALFYHQDVSDWSPALATVTDVEAVSTFGMAGTVPVRRISYRTNYTYTIDGVTYGGVQNLSHEYEEDDNLNILYDPDNFTKSTVR